MYVTLCHTILDKEGYNERCWWSIFQKDSIIYIINNVMKYNQLVVITFKNIAKGHTQT